MHCRQASDWQASAKSTQKKKSMGQGGNCNNIALERERGGGRSRACQASSQPGGSGDRISKSRNARRVREGRPWQLVCCTGLLPPPLAACPGLIGSARQHLLQPLLLLGLEARQQALEHLCRKGSLQSRRAAGEGAVSGWGGACTAAAGTPPRKHARAAGTCCVTPSTRLAQRRCAAPAPTRRRPAPSPHLHLLQQYRHLLRHLSIHQLVPLGQHLQYHGSASNTFALRLKYKQGRPGTYAPPAAQADC